jgi:protein phosphatase 2C family protein 2/3
MEDAHTTILNLEESTADKNAFFAVYDGHGGKFFFFDRSLEF